MAFTVTARHSGNSGTTSAQTRATNSTTPTANSLLLVCWSSENDASATAPSFQTPTGGSLTYTQVRTAGDATSYPWNGDDSFRVASAVYRATIGGSPSAFAVTADSSSGTASFYYGVVCLDITGYDTGAPIVGTPGIAGGSKGTGNAETGTVTLGATPAAGNLIVVVFGAGADGGGGFASPTAGVGKTFTAVTNQTTAFCQTGVFYRVADGTESTTITCSDLGQTVGNYSAIAIEIKAAAGGGGTVTGVANGAFGFSATVSGIPKTSGAAAGSFGFTATASGTVGTPPVAGTAAAAFGFTGTAAGVPRTSGTAVSSFGFSTTASGIDRAVGVAAAAFGFVGAASGIDRAVGAASGAFGFAASTSGVPEVVAVAVAVFSFTATAQGFAGTPPVTGAATGLFGFTAAAQGQPRTRGTAVALFGFMGAAVARPRVVAAAVCSFGFTATTIGRVRVAGLVSANFGFTATITGLSSGAYIAPDEMTITVLDYASGAIPREDAGSVTVRDYTSTATARSPQ